MIAPANPLRLIQLTDTHLFADDNQHLLNVNTAQSFKAVIQHIKKNETEIAWMLITGDISQDSSQKSYETFLEITKSLECKIMILPGNHDTPKILCEQFPNATIPVIDIGTWRVVMLDSTVAGSNAGFLAAQQLEILDEAAASAARQHILVAVHHNPVPIGSLWLDRMMIANSHEFFACIQRHPNIQAVVWGHVHQHFDSLYSLASHANAAGSRHVRLLATPATSVQFAPDTEAFGIDAVAPGYRWLDLHDDGQIQTGIVRVNIPGLQPDTGSKGY